MLFSVIIPTCNRSEMLRSCLGRLQPAVQHIDEALYEIIVTDDSSNDESKDMIASAFAFVNWLVGPKRGPAANRNNGARQAKGEWLIFIDDDCIPDVHIMQVYKNSIGQYAGCSAFEGAILPTNWEELKQDLTECPINTSGGCFWSANIMIKAELFHAIKGFDEGYLIAAQEDQQLYLDIKKHTHVPFLAECIVVHPVRKLSFWKQLKAIPIKSKNFSLFVKKNRTYRSRSSFITQQYKFHLLSLKQYLTKRKLKSAVISFAWILWGVPLNVYNTYGYFHATNIL